MAETALDSNSGPWWKFGHVWMVIAGPALVVVASFVSYYVAVSGKDPVLDEPVVITTPEGGKSTKDSFAPAVQARNHAATGVTTAKP